MYAKCEKITIVLKQKVLNFKYFWDFKLQKLVIYSIFFNRFSL